jgi:hypothetical protein
MIFQEPKRILQIFEPEAHVEFRKLSAEAKLKWLASVQELYWASLRQVPQSRSKRIRNKTDE